MREDIERICRAAVGRGVLTRLQCAVLLELCADDATVEDFIEVAMSCGAVRDPESLRDLRYDVVPESPGEPEAVSPPKRAGGEEEGIREQETSRPWESSLVLEWFCFYCSSEGILGTDQCLAVLNGIKASADILRFAQLLLDAGICDDHLKLRELVDRARASAETGESPPTAIFGK